MLFCSSKAAVPLLLHLESMVEQDGGSVHKSGLDTSPSCPLLPQPSSIPLHPPLDASQGSGWGSETSIFHGSKNAYNSHRKPCPYKMQRTSEILIVILPDV